MRIGRFHIEISPFWVWGHARGPCGCLLIDLGRFWITWAAKDCKCHRCGDYVCSCYEK